MLSGGWNNALVPAGAVLDYYNRVESTIGRDNTGHAVRLYMVPGMIECNGGPATDTFDMLGAMRRWVERGQAPKDVRASRIEHGKVVRTRPLCPYPQAATYRGSGASASARRGHRSCPLISARRSPSPRTGLTECSSPSTPTRASA